MLVFTVQVLVLLEGEVAGAAGRVAVGTNQSRNQPKPK
jgi:hypothetical protein